MKLLLCLLLFQSRYQSTDPLRIEFCALTRDIDSFVGKKISIDAIWKRSPAGNRIVSVENSCPQTRLRRYPTNELFLVFPKETDLSPDDEPTRRSLKLLDQFDIHIYRRLQTWVSVTGKVVRFQKNPAAREGEEDYGFLGVWPYGIQVERIVEFEK